MIEKDELKYLVEFRSVIRANLPVESHRHTSFSAKTEDIISVLKGIYKEVYGH